MKERHIKVFANFKKSLKLGLLFPGDSGDSKSLPILGYCYTTEAHHLKLLC